MIGVVPAALVIVASLGAFAYIGVRAAHGRAAARRGDVYLTARRTQGSTPLALSFFASALGAWILFSPPEVGTFGGLLGILGYATGQAAAIWIFMWLGRAVRARMPHASTILGFVRAQQGRAMQAFVGAVSVLYMFVFLTAELTGIGGAFALLSGMHEAIPIVAVASVTAAYTAYGGLPASLATDRWQAWLILSLVAIGIAAVAVDVPGAVGDAAAGGIFTVSRSGAETFVVLAIAIVAANLFHQGFWQRVWASADDRALSRGAAAGGALIFPVVVVVAAAGAVAAGRGVETPSLALFEVVAALPAVVLGGLVLLAVALVASSVDTLQNAIASLIEVDVMASRWRTSAARVATVALTVPAAAIALRGYSVLRLFLIADLLATTLVFPVFLTLWRRVPAPAAMTGAVAGLVGVVMAGWARGDAFVDGLWLLTLPEGPSVDAFVAALVVSGVTTALLASWARGERESSPTGSSRVAR